MTASLPRRLAVLTGGGDCPGLNAVLRAVTKNALHLGVEVLGIEDGFEGLIEDRLRPLGYEDVSNILTTGGTILGTSNRADPGRHPVGTNADGSPVFEDLTDRCLAHLEARGVQALVAIGGDGTLSITRRFADAGLACVGVPKTIDNDVVGTELTFGFLTAAAIATEALDRVHTTAASHHRALVVEVMGRNAGWLALHAGVAAGADVILIPEIPFRHEAVADLVRRRHGHGKRFTVLCVSEGARPAGGERVVAARDPLRTDPVRLGGLGAVVAAEIERRTDSEARSVVLGHTQRGGPPIAADRVLSTLYGDAAMALLRDGRAGRVVALQEGRLTDVPLEQVADRQRTVPSDHPLLAAARGVYTTFGE